MSMVHNPVWGEVEGYPAFIAAIEDVVQVIETLEQGGLKTLN